MQCQLCTALGGDNLDYDGLATDSLRNHSKIHQAQIDVILLTEESTECSWNCEILKQCFPNVNANDDTELLNGNTEIAGGTCEFLEELEDGNNGCKTKRPIQDRIDEGQEEPEETLSDSTLGPPSSKKRRTIATEEKESTIATASQISDDLNAIQDHCYELRKKYGRKNKMTCQLCSKDVVAKNKGNAVDHVTCMHFDHLLFTCRICDKLFGAYSTVASHIGRVHSQSAVGAYTDDSYKYKNEIIELLNKCYQLPTVTEESTENASSSIYTEAITICFRKLKRKFGVDGTLTCRLCSKQLRVLATADAVAHISAIHLGKALFSCCLCSKGYYHYRKTLEHIRRIHKICGSGNYISHTEEYEKEIVEWLISCFGEAEKKDEEERCLPTNFESTNSATINLCSQSIAAFDHDHPYSCKALGNDAESPNGIFSSALE